MSKSDVYLLDKTFTTAIVFKQGHFPDRKQPMTVENMRLNTVAAVATFISPFSNPIIFYFNIKSFKTYVDNTVLWVMGKQIEIRDRDVSGRYASRNSTRVSTVSMRSTRSDSVVTNPIDVAALQRNSTVVE